jgi:lipopolysaccharide transport system ATP-binding protein
MDRPASPYALACHDVEKSFPLHKELRVWRMLLGIAGRGPVIEALRGISMRVERGRIVGILGRNGAGKSTLLRVLGGVYLPTRGRVEANGQIAGLFELGGMGSPNLTGREYATRYLRIMGARSSDIQGLLDEIREFSELEEAFDHRVRTYSSGMGARLYFATATAMQSEIYLIDELLSVGDEHFQAKCWQRMRERLLNGASGVLVTHDWTAVLKLCEQAHVIEKGRFSFSGPSDQVVVSYLRIPVAEARQARLSERNALTHVAQTGQDTHLQLWVEILEPVAVDIAISIEMLRIGVGWEIVVLSAPLPVAERAGNYSVQIAIPELPLAPGSYSLNVFLSRRKLHREDAGAVLDMRSWTIGNGYRLQVEGPVMAAAARLPFEVRRPEAIS